MWLFLMVSCLSTSFWVALMCLCYQRYWCFLPYKQQHGKIVTVVCNWFADFFIEGKT